MLNGRHDMRSEICDYACIYRSEALVADGECDQFRKRCSGVAKEIPQNLLGIAGADAADSFVLALLISEHNCLNENLINILKVIVDYSSAETDFSGEAWRGNRAESFVFDQYECRPDNSGAYFRCFSVMFGLFWHSCRIMESFRPVEQLGCPG